MQARKNLRIAAMFKLAGVSKHGLTVTFLVHRGLARRLMREKAKGGRLLERWSPR
jgi:hypothetical protein